MSPNSRHTESYVKGSKLHSRRVQNSELCLLKIFSKVNFPQDLSPNVNKAKLFALFDPPCY